MALAATGRVSLGSTSNATVYATGSFTPSADSLIVVFVNGTRASNQTPDVPTITDGFGGLTWTQITGSDLLWLTGATRCRFQIFAAQAPSSPGSGTITATFANSLTSCQIYVFDVTGSDVANGVQQCFVQTVLTTGNSTGTSLSLTLAAAGNSNNRSFLAMVHFVQEVVSVAANWTQLCSSTNTNPGVGGSAQWRSDTFDTAAGTSWTTSSNYGGVAFEIKALAGTQFTKSLTAGLTFAGALPRRTGKRIVGAISPVGAVKKLTARLFQGGLTFSGGLAGAKKAIKTLTASLGFSGGLTRLTRSFQRGSLSFSGKVSLRTIRTLTGSISFSGASVKKTVRALSGVLGFSGKLIRSAEKSLVGSLSFSGGLVRSVGLALSGALSLSGSLLRGTQKSVVGAISFTGAVSRSISKKVSGAIGFIGDLSGDFISGSVAYVKNLTGSLSFSGGMGRKTFSHLFGDVGFSGTIRRATSRNLSGAISFAGSLTSSKFLAKLLSGALSFQGGLSRKTFTSVFGQLGFASVLSRQTAKSFSAALSFSAQLVKGSFRTLLAELSFSGGIFRQTRKILESAISFAGSLIPHRGGGDIYFQLLEGSLSFSGDMTRSIHKTIRGALSFISGLSFTKFPIYLRAIYSLMVGLFSPQTRLVSLYVTNPLTAAMEYPVVVELTAREIT